MRFKIMSLSAISWASLFFHNGFLTCIFYIKGQKSSKLLIITKYLKIYVIKLSKYSKHQRQIFDYNTEQFLYNLKMESKLTMLPLNIGRVR